jgi:glycine betaine/proline transport system substrate-binding protein
MKSTRSLVAVLLAALLLACGPAHAQSRFISLGYVDLSFYEATANVIQLVLERLGYNVAVHKGSHSEIYPMLGRGEVDLFVAAWLPNAHAKYWNEYKDSTTRVTVLFEDAKLFWAVPDYVPAAEVRSVADLVKPGVAEQMQKVIRGTRPDSGLMIGSKRIFDEYGLEAAGYQLAPGNPADWIAGFNENLAAKNWFVMPLWQPQYLNKAARLRILEEPKQLLGGTDKAWLVAHKDLEGKIDRRIWGVLQRISLSVKAVTDMDYMINVQKLSPREAARNWMATRADTLQYWMDPGSEN